MKDITKTYSTSEITIVWKPSMCIHSTKCWKSLGEVFDPRKHPWITPENATAQKIIDQIDKCPSKALSYFKNSDEPTA